MPNRCSSLPIAQFCGQAPKLQATAGAGRAAAMGSAFHARCSEEPGWELRWSRLAEAEQTEILTWHKPTDTVLEVDVGASQPWVRVLRYVDATKEFPLGLDAAGNFVEKGDPTAVTMGTCDFFWIVDVPNVGRIAYVPDIKRSEWTVADGPDSLQILAYAFAVMSKFDCDGFVAGIWGAKEGTWWWGPMLTWNHNAPALMTILRRIVAAGTNDSPDYAVGQHCSGCYGRTHCPAWLLPPELAESSLAPFTVPGMVTSHAEAVQLVRLVKRAEDTAELASKLLREHVRQHGPIQDIEAGKQWGPITTRGKPSFNKTQFEKDYPEKAQEYITPGAPYEQFRWTNIKEKKS